MRVLDHEPQLLTHQLGAPSLRMPSLKAHSDMEASKPRERFMVTVQTKTLQRLSWAESMGPMEAEKESAEITASLRALDAWCSGAGAERQTLCRALSIVQGDG